MVAKVITQKKEVTKAGPYTCDFCHREHVPNAKTAAVMKAADKGEVETYYGSTSEILDSILKEE